MAQHLTGRTVLVTGANGGLGVEFVRQALSRGARKVYASARAPRAWDDERIMPLLLDVTDPASVAGAAEVAADVDLLVNNAGIAPAQDGSIAAGREDVVRSVFETNFFGSLRVAQAFAPVLGANGGGALLNVLSLAALIPVPTAYAASKAALWSATNALRFELAAQQTTVTALFVSMVDTPMTSRFDVPKAGVPGVVAGAYDGVAAGAYEVFADADSRDVKSRLSAPAEELAAHLAEALGVFEA